LLLDANSPSDPDTSDPDEIDPAIPGVPASRHQRALPRQLAKADHLAHMAPMLADLPESVGQFMTL